SLLEQLVRQETRASEGATNVVLEVLHFVEVPAPMQAPLSDATPAKERGRVAQTLAAIGKIPDLTVFEPVQVTSRAADVAVQAHPEVRGIVEDLLAGQYLRVELFLGGNHHFVH